MSEIPTSSQSDNMLPNTSEKTLFSVQKNTNKEFPGKPAELINYVTGDNAGAHHLLNKKHFLEELKKIRVLFLKGDITRDDYM